MRGHAGNAVLAGKLRLRWQAITFPQFSTLNEFPQVIDDAPIRGALAALVLAHTPLRIT
jgi:hypothetical protein